MPIPVPCRQSNGRSEDARLEHHRRYGEKSSAVTMRSRGRLFSNGLFARGPGSGSTARGLRLVFDRDRGADLLPIDSPVSWATGALEGRTPPERERAVWSLTLGRGHFSPQPPGLATFHARALSMGWRAPRGEVYGAHGEEESLGVVRPRGLTREGSEVTVRSTSPSSAVCADLLGDRAVRGAMYAGLSFGRVGAAPAADQMRGWNFRESLDCGNQSREGVGRKVRLRP
jgi:hypothetical protein